MADRDEIGWIKIHEPWIIDKSEQKVENKPQTKAEWFIKLTKIKGIGEETTKDIGRIFDTEEDLKKALKINRVPLRNDIVDKLKDYYKQD